MVEFVSANPTGPITAASGRHAAYGDALARLLEFAGHDVSREYYFNDAGGQLIRLGESIRARARGEAVPEDGYPGEYVAELAAQIENAAERDAEDLAFAGGQLMIERIKETLERFGVRLRHLVLGAHACTTAARSSARSSGWRRPATPTGRRARCGCGPPTSATTRTA